MDTQKILKYVECQFVSENFFDSALDFFSAPFTPLNNTEMVLKEAIFFFKCITDYVKENPTQIDLGYFSVKKTYFLIQRFNISSASFRNIEDKEYFELMNKENKVCIASLQKNTTLSSKTVDRFLNIQTIYKEIQDIYDILSKLYQKEYTYFPNQTIDKIEKEVSNLEAFFGCVSLIIIPIISFILIFVNFLLALIFFVFTCFFVTLVISTPESKLIDEKNKEIEDKNKWYKLQVDILVNKINLVNYSLNGVEEYLIMEDQHLISNYLDTYDSLIQEYKKMLGFLTSFCS